MTRTSKENIILAFSFGAAIAIFPFAVLRIIDHEWTIAAVDFAMVLGMILLGAYVLVTHKTRYAGLILSLLSLGGMCTVIYLKGSSLVYWAYPTMVGMYFVISPRLAIILCVLAALVISPVLASSMEASKFIAVFMTLIVNNMFAYFFAINMHRQRDQLALLIRQDSLTKTGNRRAMDEALSRTIANIKRTDYVASLIAMDLDHFKSINDKFGHAKGDEVLIKLANLVNNRIRETDYLFRIGGEEFVILLSGADINAANSLGNEIRSLIETEQFIQSHNVTISLGIAEYEGNETASNWLNRADKALYQAKESGRNRVCLSNAEECLSVI